MHKRENLIITGFMGTGKTSVGQELARRLRREFIDMDTLIETRQGMTVAELFSRHGEPHFRRLEAAVCRELAARGGLVLATGGGALIPDANRQILAASGPVVCLTASTDEILRRLDMSKDRPLLNVPDPDARIATLLAQRREAYDRIPLCVDTSGLTVPEVADRVLGLVDTPAVTTIAVRHPGGEYVIHLGRGLLAQTGALLHQQGLTGRVAVVTNPTVGDLYAATVCESLQAAGFEVTCRIVPDGESHKTLGVAQTLYDGFIEAGLDRHDTVLALGGGVIGDMAGFAAATYLRGVSLVAVPTTLLAMVDASIGGKVAVDHPSGKNLIGAFKQPALVIADPNTLSTLPAAELSNGLAETLKAGLIGDPALFDQIETHGSAPLLWIIECAIRVKVSIVQEDPFERARRAVLNLGHTFGHALEWLSDYSLRHGEGVSIGLLAAARLSARLGLCEPDLPTSVGRVLARLGLPTSFRDHTPTEIWRAMATDKKRRGNRLRFVLPRAIGDVFVTDQVTQADVLSVLETLKEA